MDAHHVSVSMGFPRQEYWNGLSFPSPGDLSNPGIKPSSPALQAGSLPLSQQGSPCLYLPCYQIQHSAKKQGILSLSHWKVLSLSVYNLHHFQQQSIFYYHYSRLLYWTESLCATWKVACSLPGSTIHGIFQARVGCHCLLHTAFKLHCNQYLMLF